MTLLQEKARQAIEILNEQNTDMWLTWQSALLFTRKGDKIAIVGNLEKEAVARLGVFDEILGYDKSIRDLLRATISRFNPDRIAVNTSRNNVHADGLTHAMYEILRQHLSGTPYIVSRLSSTVYRPWSPFTPL